MIRLADIPTTAPDGTDEKKIRKEHKKIARRIEELQSIMYAQGKYSLLVVFQGMDSSGKDGATRETFRYCSPSGVSAVSFKKPTDEEFAHDFLWRISKEAPQKGQIKVFIRSHYEDIRSDIPWIIAPVDQRWYRNYFIASKVLETLESLDLQYPTLNTENEEWKKFV